MCERSDSEGESLWHSSKQQSSLVSRLTFRVRLLGLLHSSNICLGSTDLLVPPQQKDAFQGAFLKQGPLQTLLARYYPQLLCIGLFSHQYRSPSGSCTTGGDFSTSDDEIKAEPGARKTIFYCLRKHGDRISHYASQGYRSIDPLCFRYAVDRPYYIGISRRTCALQ